MDLHDHESEQRAVDAALDVGRALVERGCCPHEAVTALVAALAYIVVEGGVDVREVFALLAREVTIAQPTERPMLHIELTDPTDSAEPELLTLHEYLNLDDDARDTRIARMCRVLDDGSREYVKNGPGLVQVITSHSLAPGTAVLRAPDGRQVTVRNVAPSPDDLN